MSRLLKVGITHGDMNGIGYEVIVKSLANEGITELFTPVVYGYPQLLHEAAKISEIPFQFKHVSSGREAEEGKVNVVSLKSKMPELAPGMISHEAGNVAVEALEMGVEALKNGDIDVLVTAPISKESVQSDSFRFSGHTEFLEARLGEGEASQMILCNDNLRVALLTVHVPISKVAANITQEKIEKAVESFSNTLKKDFGKERPAIAVLSLNPHAGDGGLLGEEEQEIITPALNTLRNKGILAFGPFAADGFFGHRLYSNFDGILAMYHDQGLAPFKTLASAGVNFTAGLPYIRTSPDHGTAFDKAWKGIADHSSMLAAIYAAIDIYRRRKNFEEASANPLKKHVAEKPEKFDKSERFVVKNQKENREEEPEILMD